MKKRTFTKRNGTSTYRAWKEWSEGDEFIGKFIRDGKDQFGNPCWVFECMETNFESGFKVGRNATLNSAGGLNKVMEEIDPGTIVQVVYNGVNEMTKGPFAGKMAHSVEVGTLDESLMEEEETQEDFEL